MSDVPEEEEMVRYWYRKEKETEGGLGCVRITEMKGMMSCLESKSYSLPTYLWVLIRVWIHVVFLGLITT